MEKSKHILRIDTCMFKRTKDSKCEPGIAVNSGQMGIFDISCTNVDTYDWKYVPGLSIDLERLGPWKLFADNLLSKIAKSIKQGGVNNE